MPRGRNNEGVCLSPEDKGRDKGTTIALTLLVLLLIGAVAGIGTWAAFSDTTVNTDNNFVAGSVDMTTTTPAPRSTTAPATQTPATPTAGAS